MRIPFLSRFMPSPLAGLKEHAEKVKECVWFFQQAFESHVSIERFEDLRKQVVSREREADEIKRRLYDGIPRKFMLPSSIRYHLVRYLQEQDHVIDAVEDALDWISCRGKPCIPESLEKDFFLLVDSVIDPIEELSKMAEAAALFFKTGKKKQKKATREIIRSLQMQENDADIVEDKIKHEIFHSIKDPTEIYYLIRLSEIIGSIADHAENAGDIMRAVLS